MSLRKIRLGCKFFAPTLLGDIFERQPNNTATEELPRAR